jgi:murein DD-endopeptidase MepM/ murein hydrolase activator NlpD
MCVLFTKLLSSTTLRFGVLCLVAIAAAGCSSDATRLADNPLGSPYASRTASDQPVGSPAPSVARIERQSAPPVYRSAQAPRAGADTTGSVRPAPGGHWDWNGGTAVVVGPGETLESVARKHGVPVEALAGANSISDPASVRPGQRLVIPRYTVPGAGTKIAQGTPHESQPRSGTPGTSPGGARLPPSAAEGTGQTLLPVAPVHTVASGDTLSKIARQYRVKVKDLAVANGIEPDARLAVGTKLAIPVPSGAAPAKAAAAPGARPPVLTQTVPVAARSQPRSGAAVPIPVVASADAPANARVAAVGEAPTEPGGAPAVGATQTFRWPIRGRVINNFAAKVNGAANDGIDLAVPEGTPIRAADDGVVAYAGSELKGYGNLVLLRHANGFVTAYANASELMVKRNEQVHKGQVIAKSGQTGTAAAPQLHFEVRKNSTPVDPMQYLPADKTASAPL